MKKFILLMILTVVWLVGCQDVAKEESTFKLEDSIKNGDVIVVDTGQSMPNTYKIYNLDKLFMFINKANGAESSELKFINVTKDGKSVENKLSSNRGNVTFDNKFLGMKDYYLTGGGETLIGLQETKPYECGNINASNNGVTLTQCKNEDQNFIIVPFKTQEFREATAKVKIKK
ncbi:hypothetical protein AWM68_02085 [Fictibacillus phosphorivorans]|uniref:Lipoprotein n=1 Tax=Fictibacillus phosphorivorans TaxID=1221500 RepID=A0A163SH57_9BACL|nr:DUF4362 domain-containing protein [Fictibacillus phosphorivorans]KZE69077.1 hypothetical protein AWM68_02085 [Fictibacillus phosphorivorans]